MEDLPVQSKWPALEVALPSSVKSAAKTQSVPESAGKSSLQLSLFSDVIIPSEKLHCLSLGQHSSSPSSLFPYHFPLNLPSLVCWAENLNFWPGPGGSCSGKPAPRETKCFLLLKGNNVAVWWMSTGKSLINPEELWGGGDHPSPITWLGTKECSWDEEKAMEIGKEALKGCKEVLLLPHPCPRHAIPKFQFHVTGITLHNILGTQKMKCVPQWGWPLFNAGGKR